MRASDWLAELEWHFGSVTDTLRFSSHGYVSHPADEPANTVYERRLMAIGAFGVHLFGPGRTMGAGSVSVTDLTIANVDDALSDYIHYGFDGRTVVLRRLTDPRGPLAMGNLFGPTNMLEVLFNLQTVYGDPRYRPSPWLRRRGALGLSLLHEEE